VSEKVPEVVELKVECGLDVILTLRATLKVLDRMTNGR
jgi:hypothetical protein